MAAKQNTKPAAVFGRDENKSNRRQGGAQKLPVLGVEFVPATSVQEKLSLYESLSIKSNPILDGDSCRPSGLKDFQREKLEKICKNKIKDQLRNQANVSFVSFEFTKNGRTGEYEAEVEVVEKIRTESARLLKEKSAVQMIIEQLERSSEGSRERKQVEIPNLRPIEELVRKFS